MAIAFAQGGSPQSSSPKEGLETCIGGSGCEMRAQAGSPQSPSPKEGLETCIGGSGCESVLRRRLRRIDSPR